MGRGIAAFLPVKLRQYPMLQSTASHGQVVHLTLSGGGKADLKMSSLATQSGRIAA
jgi:hypothetical protein